MSAADPTAALAAYLVAMLSAKPNGKLTEGLSIFRPELPRDRQEEMPRECVVLFPAGGGQMFGKDDLPVWDTRVDVYCYGSTRLEADNLGREVTFALRALTTSTWENVKLYWARFEGITAGVEAKEDPQTLWPVTVVTAQVMHNIE